MPEPALARCASRRRTKGDERWHFFDCRWTFAPKRLISDCTAYHVRGAIPGGDHGGKNDRSRQHHRLNCTKHLAYSSTNFRSGSWLIQKKTKRFNCLELLASSLAQIDALSKLLIEKMLSKRKSICARSPGIEQRTRQCLSRSTDGNRFKILAHRVIEWVDFGSNRVQRRMRIGFEAFASSEKTGMLLSWQHQPSGDDDCGMRMRFPDFGHSLRCEAFSVIRRHALLALCDAQKTMCGGCGQVQPGWYDRRVRRVRDLSCGDTRVYLEFEVRRLLCRSCGKVKREGLEFLADNPFYTKRFAYYVRRRVHEDPSINWRDLNLLQE